MKGSLIFSPRIVAILQASIMVAAASCVGVLVKLALRDVPPFTFVWLQIAIGGSFLTLYTAAVRKQRLPQGLGHEVWIHVVLIGVGNFTLVRVLFMLSLQRLEATTNVYLVNFVGVLTMLLSILILKERPSPYQVLGAVIAFSGLRVFFDELPVPTDPIGLLYVGIGVLALAVTNNVVRRLALVTRNQLSNNAVSMWAAWIGGIPVVLYGISTDWPPAVHGASNWGILVGSGVVSIAIGLTVWNHVLRTLRSYEASLLASSSVIFTALFAVPILGERLTLRQSLGIVVMLAGLFLVQLRQTIPSRR